MEMVRNEDRNDKKIAVLSSFASLFVIFILLYINTINQNSNTDKVAPELIAEIPLESLITPPEVVKAFEAGGGGGGGGTPTNDKVDPTPRPQTDNVVTSKSSDNIEMSSGKSNKTTADDSQNTATSTKKSKNPFGDGGNGDGEGGGVGKGKGLGFGPDEGDGKGPGKGPGTGGGDGKRIRLNDPKVDDIISDVYQKISLRVKVDADGNVISAVSTSRTTTTSQVIINKVISATISQVKYNKKPGAGIEEQFIPITLRPR